MSQHNPHRAPIIEQGFEHLPVSAFVVNESKIVLAINKEARRLLGARSSALGKETCQSLSGCRIPDGACPLKKAFLRRSPVYRAEIAVSTSHGKRIRIERIATFQESGRGERLAVLTCGDATGFFRRMRRLRYQAHVDVLTRLLNRRHFDEAVSRSMRSDRRKNTALFAMIDVDGLKQVNDRQGHAAGDDLLRRLGNLLHQLTRRGDIVGRLGGDEFGIHCANITRIEARKLIQRLRRGVKNDNALHSREARLSIGIGVAISEDRRKDLREEADIKLLRYKKRRRRPGDEAKRGLSAKDAA